MDPDFLYALARQMKRHPQSYPSWLLILADDVTEAYEAVRNQRHATAPDFSDLEANFARRVLSS